MKYLLKLSFVFGAWVAALILVGNFSWRAALLLSWAFTSTGAAILALRRHAGFSPYELAIKPHWHVILEEMRLYPAGSEQERSQWFQERLGAAGPVAKRLLKEGLRITFVTRATAYVHHVSYFMSLVNVQARLLELNASEIDQWIGIAVKLGREGYDIYLVQPGWFRLSGNTDEPKLLGTIPLSLFRLYNWAVDSEGAVRQDLLAAGWDVREGDFLSDRPFSISNQYLTATVRNV